MEIVSFFVKLTKKQAAYRDFSEELKTKNRSLMYPVHNFGRNNIIEHTALIDFNLFSQHACGNTGTIVSMERQGPKH